MAWVLARKGVSKSGHIPEFVAIFDEALPLLGVQFLMMVIMAMVSCFVLYRYFAWRTKNNIRSFQNGSRPPRLIVSPLVQWTLGVCTLVGVTLTFFYLQHECSRDPVHRFSFWAEHSLKGINTR